MSIIMNRIVIINCYMEILNYIIDTISLMLCDSTERQYFAVLKNVLRSICQSLMPFTQYLPNLVLQRVNNDIDVTGENCIQGINNIFLFFERKVNIDNVNNCPHLRTQFNEITKRCEACPTETSLWNKEIKKCDVCPIGFE